MAKFKHKINIHARHAAEFCGVINEAIYRILVREPMVGYSAEYRGMFRVDEADFDYLLNLLLVVCSVNICASRGMS